MLIKFCHRKKNPRPAKRGEVRRRWGEGQSEAPEWSSWAQWSSWGRAGLAKLVVLAALASPVLAATEGLGPLLRHDGFQIRPPSGFRMARMDLFHGTHAGTISVSPSASRYLSAALVDGEGEDAATLLISVIDATFALGPSSRDEMSTAVVRHIRDELGQPFQLERAEVTLGRVEVLGSVRQGSQLRRVLVAAWPGQSRHIVAMFSAPSGRWGTLTPLVAESFASLKLDPVASRAPQGVMWAFAALAAALLLISVGLWRRRQSTRKALT